MPTMQSDALDMARPQWLMLVVAVALGLWARYRKD